MSSFFNAHKFSWRNWSSCADIAIIWQLDFLSACFRLERIVLCIDMFFLVADNFRVPCTRQYTLKVKGYRTSAALAKIYVQSVGSVSGSLVEPGPVLPTAEGWISVTFTAPSTATYIKVGVLVYSPAVGDQFFLNRMELYEYNGGQANMVFAQNGNFTYQYHLKDHLGNVRLTFTTKDEKDISKATMETANSNTEQGQFLYYDEAVKVNSKIFDRTDVGPTWYSTRLNGSTNERFGLAKSLSVMPGDTVRAAVYAKYLDPDSSNWTVELAAFIHSFGSGAPAGTFIDGGLLGSTGGVTIPFAGALNKSNETGSAPKAYLNYIVFDRDFNFKDGGYVRVTTAAREYGQKGPHEELAKELVITEPGYVYLYISNDNVSLGGGEVEVYWDDFKVEHVKSPVISSQDYYPFGLSFNSYSRENAIKQDYLYNSKELQDELNLNWYDYQARMYDPAIARWMAIDPLSEKSRRWSPYSYCYNNPLIFVDPDGMFADYYDQDAKKIGTDGKNDGKVVVVTDKKEVKAISATDKAGGVTSRDNVKSGVELPSAKVREQMGNAVDRSNAKSDAAGDKTGGFHEEGGIYGKTNGEDKVVDANPGPYADPSKVDHAEVDVWSGETPTNYVEEAEGTFHVHPAGEVTTGGGANTIGGEKTHNFDQSPSPQDYSTAGSKGETGNHYVLGARSGTVTIYNGGGQVATFPLKDFRTIGIKKP